MIFKPNPFNKSAKTMRKVTEHHHMFFCNTTHVSTRTAKERAAPDVGHVVSLIAELRKKVKHGNAILLICGKQAEEVYNRLSNSFSEVRCPHIIMPHPASRSLTNATLESVKLITRGVTLNEYSTTFVNNLR
jgi:hypothetical protein